MHKTGKPSRPDCVSRSIERDLETLINEERALFHLDDEADEDTHRLRQARIYELRSEIARFPARTLTDVLSKALYLERLYHECGESLDHAIEADNHSDVGIALVVVRDLLSCPDVQLLLKEHRMNGIFDSLTGKSPVRH